MSTNKKLPKDTIKSIIKIHKHPPAKLKIQLQKLKTIKDFRKLSKNKLRKEARNWIKFIKRDVKEMHEDKGDNEGASYHYGQIDWLELFFNIKKKI